MADDNYRDHIPAAMFFMAIAMVLGAFTIVIFLLISVRRETLINRQNGLINQTYVRATNCFAATTPTKRTPEYVQQCYEKAQQTTGTLVEHYGDGK